MKTNREIEADGVKYPPGTPVSDLPARVRDSVVSVGWADDHGPNPKATAAPIPSDSDPADPPATKPRPSRAKPKA